MVSEQQRGKPQEAKKIIDFYGVIAKK